MAHPLMSEVNIMLLGMTGSGKSASGNTIIGENKFKEDFSPSSVTKICKSESTEVNEQTITVIDTVGLSDTDVKITDAQTQIEKKLQITNLDVFLLVLKLGEAFTKEKREVVKWILENFGEKVFKHSIVLFTHGDALTVPIERYLSESETLRSVVDQCSGGCHVFKNKVEDQSQVTELLEKINTLRVKNKYRRYTEQDYANAQKSLLLKKCAKGAGVGAAAAAVGGVVGGGAVAAKIGVAALIGATGGAALIAIGAGLGVYFWARKDNPLRKDKGD